MSDNMLVTDPSRAKEVLAICARLLDWKVEILHEIGPKGNSGHTTFLCLYEKERDGRVEWRAQAMLLDPDGELMMERSTRWEREDAWAREAIARWYAESTGDWSGVRF